MGFFSSVRRSVERAGRNIESATRRAGRDVDTLVRNPSLPNLNRVVDSGIRVLDRAGVPTFGADHRHVYAGAAVAAGVHVLAPQMLGAAGAAAPSVAQAAATATGATGAASAATNAALIESAIGTAGYGASSATVAATATAAAAPSFLQTIASQIKPDLTPFVDAAMLRAIGAPPPVKLDAPSVAQAAAQNAPAQPSGIGVVVGIGAVLLAMLA